MTVPLFLLERKFRSNPRYELIEWNCLSQPEQQALAGLSKDPEVFGIFRPLPGYPSLTCKVAYKEVALLYYALSGQQVLPAYARLGESNDLNEHIARLVLEGVLEIEGQEMEGQETDGQPLFVSGPAAHRSLYGSGTTPENADPARAAGLTLISDLSRQALEYVLRLREVDARDIAARLYSYNTLPVFAGKLETLCTRTDLENFLGIADGAPYEWQLNRHWQKHPSSPESKWLVWSRKGDTQRHSGQDSTYKMYISPHWESLPKALIRSIRILSSSRAFSFKIGNDPHGLLRPDKMVVYFRQHKDLLDTARAMQYGLKDIPAHGVPFTAQLDDQGLLSWGVDPPGSDVLEHFEGGSWRARITERLAAAISQASATGLTGPEILRYSLDKMRLEGIDTGTWTPDQHIWQ